MNNSITELYWQERAKNSALEKEIERLNNIIDKAIETLENIPINANGGDILESERKIYHILKENALMDIPT